MRPSILKRTASSLAVVLGVTFITFALMQLAPGDAALEIAIARHGSQSEVDQATIDWIIESEGLDKPLWQQYRIWLGNVMQLDLGRSLVDETPVMELIWLRFTRTLELTIAAMTVAMAAAFPLGFLSGIRAGTWVDTLCTSIAVMGISIPNYWLGLLLINFFCITFQLLPSFGRGDFLHLILPSLTLGTAITAYTAKVLRAAVIREKSSLYLMALKARGISAKRTHARHILKNSMIPVITVVGLEFAMILEGAVITETIFGWPGLGDLLVTAVSNRDYPLIQGIVIFTALLFVAVNTVVDIIYAQLDPRIRQP
ncbi:ABC transporter permease [Desulfotignum phosphitoxidans]|uniref:Glutathione transport system permease protein GsiC n=1 Tax=Desulfotignum phosphitoxidans DSM 13687 TaxID=1286635 RepID=S0G364_9BACT|nr:ABC transporter permease [Desulfotignum phosphitoxidans]EMS81325.1 glutathione transport system permease protein GsiC [Desulfotignum phosphitoxidans DSM 13687]